MGHTERTLNGLIVKGWEDTALLVYKIKTLMYGEVGLWQICTEKRGMYALLKQHEWLHFVS